jgi:ABC-2 type transport system permease protein
MNPLHTFSRGRKWNIALQVVVAVAAFMAIVVMVNYLSARHFKRFHWSDRGSVALTPRTLALLQSMTNQVEVTVFFDSEAVLFVPVNQVLEEYRAASPNLTVRKVDQHRNPAAAQALRRPMTTWSSSIMPAANA